MQQLYFGTLALASHWYHGNNTQKLDLFQSTRFKESIALAVKITSEKGQTFMKSNVFQLSHEIKNIYRSRFYQLHTHRRKAFLKLLLLKICGSFLFKQNENECGIFWSVWVFFAFPEVRRLNNCSWEANLVFYIYKFDLM